MKILKQVGAAISINNLRSFSGFCQGKTDRYPFILIFWPVADILPVIHYENPGNRNLLRRDSGRCRI
jgi:hypothetical protein